MIKPCSYIHVMYHVPEMEINFYINKHNIFIFYTVKIIALYFLHKRKFMWKNMQNNLTVMMLRSHIM